MKVAVVDYGMGNLHSVRNAIEMSGGDAVLAKAPEDLRDADRIVLPGVGAFGECVKNLRASGLLESLDEEVRKKGKPLLGICLGMQVLASAGEEMGEHEGLGWIPGRVVRLRVEGKGLRVPHVGWNEVVLVKEHPVLAKVAKAAKATQRPTFYFVHSYAFEPASAEHTVATCDYGYEFTCAVAKDNIIATQFHPEKSQQNGLALVESFLEWSPC